jgi:hypothetical protein
MDAFFIVFGGLAVFGILMAIYIHIQEKKEEAKPKKN